MGVFILKRRFLSTADWCLSVTAKAAKAELGLIGIARAMENCEEDTVELHGDEEIIEVIELNDTEQTPAGWCTFTLFVLMVSGSLLL